MSSKLKIKKDETFSKYLWDELEITYTFNSVNRTSKKNGHGGKSWDCWEVKVAIGTRTSSVEHIFTAYFGVGYKEITVKDVLSILVREYKDIMEMSAIDLLENDWGYDLFDMVQTCREMLSNARRLSRAIGHANVNKLIEYFEDQGGW